jgi:hypothetical protein
MEVRSERVSSSGPANQHKPTGTVSCPPDLLHAGGSEKASHQSVAKVNKTRKRNQ